MAIRKPVKLKWKGEEYSIIISMDVIERVDNELGIIDFMNSQSAVSPPIVKISKLIYILLDHAGAFEAGQSDDDKWKEVYDGFGDSKTIDKKALNIAMAEIAPQLLPNFNGIAKKKVTPKKRSRARKR